MRTFFFFFTILSAFAVQAQQKLKVACIGDGLTEGVGIEEGKRYPAQLQEIAGEHFDVKNFGLDGRTMLKKGDSSYWLEPDYKEALAWNPDIVIIAFGTGDSKPQNWIYSEDFESEYIDFIRSFKTLPGSRRVVLCLPPPVFNDNADVSEVVIRDEIIPIIKKISLSQKAMLVDLHTLLSGKSALFPDGIHPNAEVSALVANEIYNKIR